jgi:DNA-binding NarL/FixJ family response regulator
VPGLEFYAEWCRGLVAEEPEALRGTASYYRSVGRPLEFGLVTEDLAELLAKRGEITEARALLTESAACYAGLRATWDVRRADRRLARFGVRRDRTADRRRPATGIAALTPTELAVARLVATGLSNADIAAKLVQSRRTVHTHVSRILAKLGGRSRVDITRQLLTET